MVVACSFAGKRRVNQKCREKLRVFVCHSAFPFDDDDGDPQKTAREWARLRRFDLSAVDVFSLFENEKGTRDHSATITSRSEREQPIDHRVHCFCHNGLFRDKEEK